MLIRQAEPRDDEAIWLILEPTFRAGQTYPISRDISRSDALAYWPSPEHSVFVADDAGAIVGTYYLRANNRGGVAHVANCGYVLHRGRMAEAWRGRCVPIRWTRRVGANSRRCSSISSFPRTTALS